jgi:hypothetical protein
MQFFIFDAAKLDSLTSDDGAGDDILAVLRQQAASVFENENLAYCMEAYSGITDDHDVDFMDYAEHPAAQNLSEKTDGDGAWFAFIESDAKSLSSKLRGIAISEEDAGNYMGEDDLEEHVGNLRQAHSALQQQLASIRAGQIGILRIEQ